MRYVVLENWDSIQICVRLFTDNISKYLSMPRCSVSKLF